MRRASANQVCALGCALVRSRTTTAAIVCRGIAEREPDVESYILRAEPMPA